MRVYLPTTLPRLAAAVAAGTFGSGAAGTFGSGADGASGSGADGGLEAHAVTPAVREWYTEGDLEELEYAVLIDAAQACLRLLAQDDAAEPRRVVVAADVPDQAVRPVPETGRSRVRLSVPVPLDAVASVHVDEPAAGPTVVAAVQALPAADAGDDDALFALDEAQACDLLWYDVTEIPQLIA
jgi:hypothetical protein